MVYVVPLQGMIIRPGQHISGEGRVYHPYLANWEKLWDVRQHLQLPRRKHTYGWLIIRLQRSNLQDFFAILRNVFSKEPPIVVQQNIGPPPVQQSQSPPPIPPLPQELEQSLPHPPNISNSSPVTQQPPPPPPKPRSQLASNQSFTTTSYANSASGLIQGQPNTGQGYQAPAGSRYANSLGTSNLDSPPRADVYRGPPTLSQRAPMKSNTDSPVSPVLPQDIRWRQQEEQNHISQVSATAFHSYGPSALSNNRRSGPYDNRISQNNLQPQLTPNSRPNPKNIPNLLDTPADLILPQPSNLPVPPVPPNPEKDHLLQSLGIALFQQRQASQAQSQSSLHSLEAQHHALSNAASGLQAEIEAIEELSESLISNEKILKTSMQKAEQVMADAQRRAVPRVDDVLVAPTTVATQLYDLVAEERAIGDAIFILARGMDKGRIGMDVFLKVGTSPLISIDANCVISRIRGVWQESNS